MAEVDRWGSAGRAQGAEPERTAAQRNFGAGPQIEGASGGKLFSADCDGDLHADGLHVASDLLPTYARRPERDFRRVAGTGSEGNSDHRLPSRAVFSG